MTPKKEDTTPKKKTAPEKPSKKTSPGKGKNNSKITTDNKKNTPEKSSGRKVPEAFLKDLKNLGDILAADPDIINPIHDILECQTTKKLTRKSFTQIVNSLSILIGPGPAMVILTAGHVNSISFFEDVIGAVHNDEISLNAIMAVREITAFYGHTLQKAYSLSSGTMDEDWHTIDVNTYKRENEMPSWIIEMRLAQYSGNEILLKMTPDSAFQFVDIIMNELLKNVPAEEVDPDLTSQCRQTILEFRDKFAGKSKGKGGTDDEHPPGYA